MPRPLDDFIGRHLRELGFLKDKAFARRAFTELKTNGYIRYEDLPLETREGRAINVEFISNIYLVGEKRIIQCNIRDVTERKQAEAALALAGRRLNLMSGITRHDITNQLTALSGFLDLALETATVPEGVALIDRAHRAADTIQRLIAFTKEYEDLGAMAPVWQGLSEVIRSAASQMGESTINFEIPDDRLELLADPLLIRVFYNLFENSRQHEGAVT